MIIGTGHNSMRDLSSWSYQTDYSLRFIFWTSLWCVIFIWRTCCVYSLTTFSQKRTESTALPGLVRSTVMQTTVELTERGVRQTESISARERPPPNSNMETFWDLSSTYRLPNLKSRAVVSVVSSLTGSPRNLAISDVLPLRFSPTNRMVFSPTEGGAVADSFDSSPFFSN